jgi:methyl-accepting chemotaxis protein
MRDTNSYVSYMNMKELAGRDRAILAGIIGAGKADVTQLIKVSGNLGEYKRALAQFSLVATPEQLALHREKVVGKAVDEVERIHKVVLDTPVGQELGLDGAYWFDMSTERINMMKEVQDKLAGNLHDRAAEKRDAATATLVITAAVTGILLLVAILTAWLSARSITGPLNQMRTTITEVEKNGDFTRRIPVNNEDEVGQTAKSFNELMAALQQTLGQILDSVGRVSDAALSVSSSSSQVATSSSSQSEATSAMAAAVEQMTVSINHVSDSAHEAVDISRKSGKLSTEGGEVIHKAAAEMSQIAETVRDTAQAIAELGQHSNQISSIVQVIKDVADQTNLLALNAAIEAARAGEQGRGFAVVADEVRKLAERTTKATEEITQMIASMQHSARAAVSTMDSAVDQVSGGVSLAKQAGSAIVQIKDGAEQVVGVVNDISSALAEQSSASNDIAAQVEKVAQMTEENSAAAAETASAANNLQILADSMQAAVSRFKI